MPPKRRTQAGRVSKRKADATIRRVAASTFRQPILIDPPVLPANDPDPLRIPSPVLRIPSPVEEIPRIDIALLNSLITRLEGYETGLDAVKTTIHDNQIEARQANLNIFNQLMERLDNLGTAPAERTRIDSQAPGTLPGTSSLVAVNVLARWSWIDLPTAESIANGSFEINSLSKLHRDEGLRNRHVAKTFESFIIPLDGSKPELVSGRTKMQSAFRDLSTFLSAWLIYISVRTSYCPERGPGLASWTERLVFLSQCGYPWSTILNYAIAYYGDHQNSPIEAWFKVDAELIANHFGISQQRSSNQSSAKLITSSSGGSSVGPSKTVQASYAIPKHRQICLNYNRDRCTNPCATGRRHVCAICAKDHAASHCPLGKQSAS
jgi:hypothetical protein